jgi:hypothetical protein
MRRPRDSSAASEAGVESSRVLRRLDRIEQRLRELEKDRGEKPAKRP